MKNLLILFILLLSGFSYAIASGPDGEDILKKAITVVDETARRNYSTDSTEARKISYASVVPVADEKNVVITFTINTDNKIHVVDVQGGYAFINHYIRTSLEGKEIKTENAIPGINYLMTIKLPASA